MSECKLTEDSFDLAKLYDELGLRVRSDGVGRFRPVVQDKAAQGLVVPRRWKRS